MPVGARHCMVRSLPCGTTCGWLCLGLGSNEFEPISSKSTDKIQNISLNSCNGTRVVAMAAHKNRNSLENEVNVKVGTPHHERTQQGTNPTFVWAIILKLLDLGLPTSSQVRWIRTCPPATLWLGSNLANLCVQLSFRECFFTYTKVHGTSAC